MKVFKTGPVKWFSVLLLAQISFCEGKINSVPLFSSNKLMEIPSSQSHNRNSNDNTSRGSYSSYDSVFQVSRGGGGVTKMVGDSVTGLQSFLKGPKSDTLLLLLTTALNNPISNKLGISPILGFLATGLLLGPNGKNLIKDIHTTEMLADLGIVLFLFEMGIHLSFDTLKSMKRDVFGVGLSQFSVTAALVAGVAKFIGKMSNEASIIIGGSLALSSSAFVLQLLKDKDQLGTQFGKSSFGVLLLQDLMVVPLLVITPILAGGGDGLKAAVSKAGVQLTLALAAIFAFGKFLLNPMFDFVSKVQSQEAFIGVILMTVLGSSFLTEGLGLSNTLGAFLSGVLLADTKHRHQVETEISPFRGILVGLFFFSVGFEIDLHLIASKFGLVTMITLGMLAAKAVIATTVCLIFGLKMSIAQRAGLILSQGGEFAFVAFRTARGLGILDPETTKLLLTCVSLTMALTPFLEEFGGQLAKKLEEKEKTQ